MHNCNRTFALLGVCMGISESFHGLFVQEGVTALYVAAQNGHTAILQQLLEAKASVDAKRTVSATLDARLQTVTYCSSHQILAYICV